MNKKHITLCGYDKRNNLLFKLKNQKALFIIDFDKESVRLIRGKVKKSVKRELRKYMLQHYDLIF